MITNKVSFYLSRMNARGHLPEETLRNTGLSVKQLSHYDFKASPGQLRQIIRNMIRLTGDEHLGITLGSEFKISDLGVLGYAALSSTNLAQAREVISKYHALNEYLIVPSNYIYNDSWLIELKESHPLGELLPFTVEEFISRTIALSTKLTNKPYPILKMNLSYSAPQSMAAYDSAFGCPCFFNQPKNTIIVDKECLSDPVILANEEVHQICERQCRKLAHELEEKKPLSEKINRTLLNMPGQFPTLVEMAEKLNINARALRRQLATEDSSYMQITERTRVDLALQYLSQTTLSPKEIGFLLGYSDVSNFRRAFKNWTGKTISEYRG
ncbi:MAG: AraC family transcriptional regulator [Halieaceae bacterium]|jgi:AraC-like DNA-binding protein|nr:AraC family transcriptional regulator [Halieaceae bacterium]